MCAPAWGMQRPSQMDRPACSSPGSAQPSPRCRKRVRECVRACMYAVMPTRINTTTQPPPLSPTSCPANTSAAIVLPACSSNKPCPISCCCCCAAATANTETQTAAGEEGLCAAHRSAHSSALPTTTPTGWGPSINQSSRYISSPHHGQNPVRLWQRLAWPPNLPSPHLKPPRPQTYHLKTSQSRSCDCSSCWTILWCLFPWWWSPRIARCVSSQPPQ